MERTTLDQWLHWLTHLHPKVIDLDLERVSEVAQRLNLLKSSAKIVTVGGTNGKGTCVATLEAIYKTAGYSVGAYVSPHLMVFNERIRSAGVPISDSDLLKAFKAVEEKRGDVSLTYFEFTTLAALWHFQQKNHEVLILEVGLGGRLDAVNILDCDVAVITSIAFDHEDYLGHHLEDIATEKAGILREHKPVIFGQPSVPKAIESQSQRLQAPLFVAGRDYTFAQTPNNHWHWKGNGSEFEHLRKTHFPLENAAAALMAVVLLLPQLPVESRAVQNALNTLYVTGRYQRVHQFGRQHVFDVAHNPAAAQWLANQLRLKPCAGRVFAIVGMLKDKNIAETLLPFQDLVDEWVCVSIDEPRGSTAWEIGQHLALWGCQPRTYQRIADGYIAALEESAADDLILIFGSFLTVAGVMESGATLAEQGWRLLA